MRAFLVFLAVALGVVSGSNPPGTVLQSKDIKFNECVTHVEKKYSMSTLDATENCRHLYQCTADKVREGHVEEEAKKTCTATLKANYGSDSEKACDKDDDKCKWKFCVGALQKRPYSQSTSQATITCKSLWDCIIKRKETGISFDTAHATCKAEVKSKAIAKAVAHSATKCKKAPATATCSGGDIRCHFRQCVGEVVRTYKSGPRDAVVTCKVLFTCVGKEMEAGIKKDDAVTTCKAAMKAVTAGKDLHWDVTKLKAMCQKLSAASLGEKKAADMCSKKCGALGKKKKGGKGGRGGKGGKGGKGKHHHGKGKFTDKVAGSMEEDAPLRSSDSEYNSFSDYYNAGLKFMNCVRDTIEYGDAMIPRTADAVQKYCEDPAHWTDLDDDEWEDEDLGLFLFGLAFLLLSCTVCGALCRRRRRMRNARATANENANVVVGVVPSASVIDIKGVKGPIMATVAVTQTVPAKELVA